MAGRKHVYPEKAKDILRPGEVAGSHNYSGGTFIRDKQGGSHRPAHARWKSKTRPDPMYEGD